MGKESAKIFLEELKSKYPDKFVPEDTTFKCIKRGNRIFIGTACGEPQHLVGAMIDYVNSHPKAFFDAEIMQVWTLGLAPYAQQKFKTNFRQNSFFIGGNTRESVNQGLADYTPVFLSRVPDLFARKLVPIDVALIQTSLPDEHGYLSLGVSVDITKTAAENAKCVVAQVNSHMPRVHGDSFIHIDDIRYIIPHDEPLLEYDEKAPVEIADRLGRYVARIVQDGDTIQVGYGSTPNSIIPHLRGKKHLGVHTELLTEAMIDLIRSGAIDNSRKSLHRGKSVASFCMGTHAAYEFLDDNPSIEFRRIDYVNDPLVIARNERMTAINSALQVDRQYFLQRDRRQRRLHARRAPLSRRKNHPRRPVHGAQRRGLAHRSEPRIRRRSHAHARRHQLRRHRIRHRVPARKKHPRARYGTHLDRASEIQAVAHRAGQGAELHL
jgi:acyl-CoA hydrolase